MLYTYCSLITSEEKWTAKLTIFHLQILQEQERQQATQVEPGSPNESKSHQSYTQDEVAPDTDIQASEMAVDDKLLEPLLPQKEIAVQTETNTTTTDGQVK